MPTLNKETMKQPFLHEDNLPSGILVLYKGKEYTTANRHHEEVELYTTDEANPKFVESVNMNKIKIKEPKNITEYIRQDIGFIELDLKRHKRELKDWEEFIDN